MFSFKPIDKQQVDDLFKQNNIAPTDTSMAVIAFNSEDNKEYGYCLFDYENLTATIFVLMYSNKYHFLPECLIKAALNFAANRGAFIAQCSNVSIEPELLKLGFRREDNILCTEIPKVMVGNCNCCNQKK